MFDDIKIILFILAFLLSACSMMNSVSYRDPQFSNRAFPRKIPYTRQQVATLLYEQLRSWKGVKYKLGGLSKQGIDCSGFVQLTFKEKFNIRLPRSIETLVKIGERVSKRHLNAGDLVFFKTGIFTRHVGIYVGSNQFMHVSKSKGVMLSTMKQQYWTRHYWQSKRIIYQGNYTEYDVDKKVRLGVQADRPRPIEYSQLTRR